MLVAVNVFRVLMEKVLRYNGLQSLKFTVNQLFHLLLDNHVGAFKDAPVSDIVH